MTRIKTFRKVSFGVLLLACALAPRVVLKANALDCNWVYLNPYPNNPYYQSIEVSTCNNTCGDFYIAACNACGDCNHISAYDCWSDQPISFASATCQVW